MPWEIQGQGEAQNPEGYDGSVWDWQVVADHDAGIIRHVIVRISGTVMAMGEEALSARIATARKTHGGSEVGMVCDWVEPPAEIEALSHGIRPTGGDPGPEQREINEIMEWFDERGAIVVFAARGFGMGPNSTPHITKHSAHIMARDVDRYLYPAEGPSRLEAARAAKDRWDAEGHGIQQDVDLEEKPTLNIDRTAVKTLRSEGYRIVWTEPTDPDDPIWMGQALGDDGELLEIALGQDPQDILLELAEALLPENWKQD